MTVNLEQKETEHFEEWLDFGLEKYHPSWRESWGKTILSDELRGAISETPRLSKRIQRQILEEVSERLFPDGVDNDVFPFSDVNLVTNFIDKSARQLSYQVGLIWYANTIKSFLNGEESHSLMEVLGADAIKIALGHSSSSPQHDTEVRIQDLKELAEAEGLRCCLNWVKQFPEYVAVKLAVLLPKPNDNISITGPINDEMVRVVNLVLSPDNINN